MTRSLRVASSRPPAWWQAACDIAEDGRIAAIEGEPIAHRARANPGAAAAAGFIDLHVHGAGGRDIMEGGDAALQVARKHAQHGTTRCWPPP